MSKKLYVGGLPYSTTEEEVKELFAPYGNTESVRIISDKFTGKSRGFGFVEMTNDDEALKAIEAINGRDLNGRSLIVNEARPEERRSFGGGGGGGRGDFGGGGGRGGFGGGGGRRDRGRGDRGGRGGGGGGNRW